MTALRTPDSCFENLPDFAFTPHYVEVHERPGSAEMLRMHLLDEGPADGPVVLLMHGEPSWCYLYRHMIPPLVDAGLRCIAPDLIGFGRSDKPVERSAHTYAAHVEWMREALFDRLGLDSITFFGQDWGGLIGLRLAAEHIDRYERIVVSNTGLNTGDRPPTEAFLRWQEFSQTTPSFPIGTIVNGGCVTDLDPAVVAAYDAPFPSDEYTAGPRTMPSLVPTSPDDPAAAPNRAAWAVLESFHRPVLTAFSDSDPVSAGGERAFQHKIPGANGQPHRVMERAGHFVQEDSGPELAQVIIDFIRSTTA